MLWFGLGSAVVAVLAAYAGYLLYKLYRQHQRHQAFLERTKALQAEKNCPTQCNYFRQCLYYCRSWSQ